MAQSVEQLIRNQQVAGSSPASSSIFVVRKNYKTKKAQDLISLVLFVVIFGVVAGSNATACGYDLFVVFFFKAFFTAATFI